MRIIHTFWSLTYGGIETMLVNIANAQAEAGAEVHILIINEGSAKELIAGLSPKVTLHDMHRRRGSSNPWAILHAMYLFWSLRPDVVHLHGSGFYHLLVGRRLSRVACSTLHDLPHGTVRRRGLRSRLLPFLDFGKNGNVDAIDRIPRVFAISEAVKEALWTQYGVQSTVVCNGILTRMFLPRPTSMPPSPLRVVQVSRLEHDKKGQDLLIHAAARMGGRIHVTFIGDGSSRNYLEQLTKELGAESWVTFLGTQPQSYVAEHLRDYDLFVQASRWEGFGLTVAEAMAARLPVLVSAGQGPAEVTCGDRYGWVFENGSIDDLVRQITHIADHYEEAQTKAGEAMRYVQATYDVSVTARKYLELYKA